MRLLVLLLTAGAFVVGGCGTEQVDPGSLLAVVPTSTVQNVSYVTNVEQQATPPEPAPLAPSPQLTLSVPVTRPPDPGCVPDDAACLEAACAHGSGHGCEARGDLYQETDDLRALDFYRHAFETYTRGCDDDDHDACRDAQRISAPGYHAHSYHAPPGCPAGYVMSEMGCIVPAAAGPVGTTVVVNGNHNVVQVFGGAAKVVGHARGQ